MLGKYDVCATIPVKDMKKAEEFYKGTLGLKKGSTDAGGTYYQSGKTGVYVYESGNGGTNKGTAVSWTVDDVDQVAEELAGKGVKFEHYDFPGTSREGDVHIMGEMRVAWFKDPSGNILGLNN